MTLIEFSSTPFRAGQDGYHTFRIPALTWTSGGDLLALCEGRRTSGKDEGDIDIVSRRSADGGRTWGPVRVVTGHGGDTAGNPTVVPDPGSGDLVLLSCRNGPEDSWKRIARGEAPPRRVYVQRSADGEEWSEPSEITADVMRDGWRWYATGPGHGIAVTRGERAGRLVVPCNHTRAPGRGDKGDEGRYAGGHAIVSDDGGRSWRVGFTSSNPNGVVDENEATGCELPDGRLYFNCRCGGSDRSPGSRADAYSEDAGESLVKSYRPQGTLDVAECQASVICLTSGLLVASAPGLQRGALGLWVSLNEGVTWRCMRHVTGLPAAYSALVEVGPEMVGVLYETGDWSPYGQIQFARVDFLLP